MLAKIASAIVSSIMAFTGLGHSLASAPASTQLAGAFAGLPAGVSDTVIVTDASGVAQTNYPYQFGRPFVQGEIPHAPQVLVNGTAVQTQADVKNRYPDGSVKFAVISVIIPSIPANGTATLSFQDQANPNNTPLSTSQMLASNFDFGAKLTLTSGTSVSADARTMLANGDYTYWASGPVATTIVLQDSSLARKYDLGFDSYRSVHPIFEATFWPSLNKVYVRVIALDDNSTALEDVQAAVGITLGNSTPSSAYTNPSVVIKAATGFTKVFWLGGVPEAKINIDNNVGYIAATKYVPNYDPQLKNTLTNATQNRYTQWTKKPKDIYQAGWWTVYMPSTGGRGDIGINAEWMTNWLYTGDWRDREGALGLADLATAWDWNVVEGDPTYKIDRAQTISGFGLPVSAYAHPKEWLFDTRALSNTIVVHGTRITPPVVWTTETAHHPDAFSIPYILTGDPFYLGELQNWAGAMALEYATCIKKNANCGSLRTLSPVVVGIQDQVRGDGWVLRTRAIAGVLSVDGTPQQGYFTDITTDAIAAWEGQRSIADPVLSSTAAYQKTQTDFAISFSPLHFFGPEPQDRDPDRTVHGAATIAASTWQDYYFIATLGYVKDMGYPAGALLTWLGKVITEQFNEMPPNGTYDIKLLSSYRTPASIGKGQPWFTDWQQVEAELLPSIVQATIGAFSSSGTYYSHLAAAAAAATTNDPGGATAWNWFVANGVSGTPSAQKNFVTESQWNIIPRSITSVPLPPPVTTPAATTTPPVVVPLPPVATTTPPVVVTPPVATTTPPVVTPPVTTTPPPTTTASSVHVSNVRILGIPVGTAGDPSLTAVINSCPDTLTVGKTCSIAVSFAPQSAGLHQATLAFDTTTDQGATVTNTVTLSGTGTTAPVTTPPVTTPPATTPPVVTPPTTTTSGETPKTPVVTPPTTTTTTTDTTTTSTTAAGTLVGTAASETLDVSSAIHIVDGKGGYDVAFLNLGGHSINSTWFSIVHNSDGSYTAKDVHATGYTVRLYNVEEIKFPSGANVKLGLSSSGVVSFLYSLKRSFELAFQGMGMRLAIALSGGDRNANLATAIIAIPPSINFGQVPVGQSVSQNLTISYGAAGSTTSVTPPGAETTHTTQTSPSTSGFAIGKRVTTTSSLNVRSVASTAGTLVGTLAVGASGVITSGPTTLSGHLWWQVQYDTGVTGWSIQDYLKLQTSN